MWLKRTSKQKIEEIITTTASGMSEDGLGKYYYELNQMIFNLVGKVDIELIQITNDQWKSVAQAQYPSLTEIELPDKVLYTTTLDGLQKILKRDWTNRIKGVAEKFDCEVNPETAYGLGLFFADGSCGLRAEGMYAGASWRIVNWNKERLERIKTAFEREWEDKTFPIRLYDDYKIGNITNYGARKRDLYCLEVSPRERHNDGSRGKFVEQFRKLCYVEWGDSKKVPACILESSLSSKRQFLEGVIDGDGYRAGRYISVHKKAILFELMELMVDVRWKSHYMRDRGDDNYRLFFNRRREGIGKILEYLDGKDFVPLEEISPATGINLNSCGRWLRELEKENLVKLERPWSQRLNAKLVGVYNHCDDFAHMLSERLNYYYGLTSVVEVWGDVSGGYPHAFNIVVLRDRDMVARCIEPQLDQVFIEDGQLGKYLPRKTK